MKFSFFLATPFRQQRLPAWQPIVSANIVISWSFVIGATFLPLGWFLLVSSDKILDFSYNYTGCQSLENPQFTCAEAIRQNISSPCTCRLYFQINQSFVRPAFFYYALTNYYQNHRRYSRSRDDTQLFGYSSSGKRLRKNCWPYHKRYDNITRKELPIAPCGAIANSLFNDTFRLFCMNDSSQIELKLLRNGIAWPSDKLYRFHNPEPISYLKSYTHPPAWHQYLYKLDSGPDSFGFQYEPLIVWMRVSALPKFRKLYARILHEGLFDRGLPNGKYFVEISYSRFKIHFLFLVGCVF